MYQTTQLLKWIMAGTLRLESRIASVAEPQHVCRSGSKLAVPPAKVTGGVTPVPVESDNAQVALTE
jgi:hypothetical protein